MRVPILLFVSAFTVVAAAAALPRVPLGGGGDWIEQKALPNDGAAQDQFGRAVVVDRDLALIASPNATVDGHEGQGAVYAFHRNGGTWTQTQKIVSSDGAGGDAFGISVAIEGTTAIVGAYSKGKFRGAAYVFAYDGDTWSETQKLVPADQQDFDQFAWSVALDGSTALIGAIGVTWGDQGGGQGAVYAFTESGGTWTQSDKFTSDDGLPADSFGWSVALDGDRAVVGTGFVTIDGTEFQGAAYTFDASGGAWAETQKLTASNGASFDFFGLAVAIEGDTILVGADGAATDGDPFSNQGAAYVFTHDGSAWSEVQQLAPAESGASDGFGEWIALEGDHAVIGAPGVTVDKHESQGAAFLFTRSSGIWSETQRFVASDGAEFDQLGWEVAISGDTLLAGAYGATVDDRAGQGAAYFWDLPAPDIVFADGFDGAAR
ncbi:MAG: hypothetical protein ABW186_13345 [Rhodanobacteraceae bacterium]